MLIDEAIFEIFIFWPISDSVKLKNIDLVAPPPHNLNLIYNIRPLSHPGDICVRFQTVFIMFLEEIIVFVS